MSARAIIAALLIAAAASGSAFAFGLGSLGASFGRMGAIGSGVPTAPPPNGSALLVNGIDAALLVDGTNPACLVGGC